MEIRYRYSLPDLVRFNAYCISHQRGMPTVAAAVTFVLVLLITTAPQQGSGTDTTQELLRTALMLGASLAFVAAGTLTFVVLSSMLRGRKQLGATNTLQISPHGVAIASEVDNSVTPWQYITTIEESRHFVVFFIDQRVAVMIPTRAFSTRYEQQTFIEHARNYLDGTAAP